MIAAGESLLKFPVAAGRPHRAGVEGDQRPEGAGHHHGHLGHVYGRPHQAPPGPSHRRPACTILFVGYQLAGHAGPADPRRQPRGPHPRHLACWSGPASRRFKASPATPTAPGLLKWLGHFQQPPRQFFITHGEASRRRWPWPSRSATTDGLERQRARVSADGELELYLTHREVKHCQRSGNCGS